VRPAILHIPRVSSLRIAWVRRLSLPVNDIIYIAPSPRYLCNACCVYYTTTTGATVCVCCLCSGRAQRGLPHALERHSYCDSTLLSVLIAADKFFCNIFCGGVYAGLLRHSFAPASSAVGAYDAVLAVERPPVCLQQLAGRFFAVAFHRCLPLAIYLRGVARIAPRLARARYL